ncbi:MAG: right-handed parallel beta-helix repeat-containing protein, partial [Anaerolineae bacterium]
MDQRPLCILLLVGMFFTLVSGLAQATGTTYYVSSSGGDDDNDGLSDLTPFETIAKVNTLDLEPGDRVLFKCGDTWQAEQLVIAASGTESDPILFGSYPEGCADKPIFSGSLPITGWTVHAGNIYRADLPAGEFPLGINQLFRDGQRLTMGRWPNLDAGNGGYSFVDSHTTGSNQIVDNELPSGVNWAGAIMHLKNIRWSMIDRQVTGSSGSTLTLNEGFSCLISSWTTCEGWGYFVNNHLGTLDQDGEWYYDASANQVYLFSASGPPSDIQGSIILDTASNTRHGGVILGLRATYVVVENLEIKNWFNHGFSTLSAMREAYAYHHITLRDNIIKDVDAVGVHLRTSIWAASNGRDGERGGHDMTFAHNVIDGANHFGVTGYFAESTFENNEIKNIALIKNLNKSAMGCGITRGECTENGDGFRITVHYVQDSGHSNTLRYNRFEKIGYNGIDVFGPYNTIANNFITQTCYSKADCGGVRTFGRDNLSATRVHDVSIVDNIIVDIPGNVDGCHASRPAFGMGLYIDHYSRDVEVRGNTVISTTITGILYQNSTGQIRDNTVYNASSGTAYAGNISLTGSAQATLNNNIMYGLTGNAWTMYSSSLSNFTASDNNYLFHPYVDEHIAHGPS